MTFVFIVTRRLKKHSILKLICFKLLGHCSIFTVFLFFFCISWLSLCVALVTRQIMFTFLQHLIFGTWVLAYGIQHLFFGIYFLAYIVCFKKHFVSISSVTFWHLYSTHAFKGATMQLSILARSDLRNSNPTLWKYPIACAPEYSRNLLFHFYFYFHFIIKMFCCALKVHKMNLFPVQ